MGPLQRWLDEPDEDIARFAKAFYALTFVFMAVFVVQVVLVFLDAKPVVTDLVGPCVAAFLALVMYCMALDGRRSYKARKLAGPVTTDERS